MAYNCAVRHYSPGPHSMHHAAVDETADALDSMMEAALAGAQPIISCHVSSTATATATAL